MKTYPELNAVHPEVLIHRTNAEHVSIVKTQTD